MAACLTTALIAALASGCATPPPHGGRIVGPAGPFDVHFEIDLRGEIAAGRFDPQRHAVGVRGSQVPLSWSRSWPAEPIGDGRYRADLRFERVPFGPQPIAYKFRLERPGDGPDAGWEPGRNHPLLIDRSPLRVARAFAAAPIELPPRRTGRIDEWGLVKSAHVAPRRVQVWVPPGYGDDASRRYPVLVLHDGQNVFDGRAAGAEWMVDESAQRLAFAGAIDPPLIVAVDSVPERRIDDYTPTAMTLPAARTGAGRDERRGGGAGAYARFLVDELKPLVEQRYRTRSGPASWTVGGSSLGGLVSLWLALERHDVFGAALVVSPSLWWDERFAWRNAEARRLPDPARPRLWLDMGALEGEEALPALRQLQEALMARGWTDGTLRVVEDAQGSHDEASWAARVEDMLRFLYGRHTTPH